MISSKGMIFISGVSRGIGESVAELCLAEGYAVVGCSRSTPSSHLIESKKFHFLQGSIDAPEFVDRVKLEVARLSKKTPLCGIVNNAGIIETMPAVRFDRTMATRLININFLSHIALMTALIPRMVVAGGGSIVSVSSNAVSNAYGGRAMYAATKAALSSYTRTLSRELGSRGIRANVIEPGLTRTELMLQSTTESDLCSVSQNVSLDPVSQPEDIAATILFLISCQSQQITGQIIRVDGDAR